VRGTEIGRQDDSRAAVKDDVRGRPPSRRRQIGRLAHEAAVDQRLDALADRGAPEARAPPQVRAREAGAVPDQLEQLPGTGAGSAAAPDPAHTANSNGRRGT